MANNVQQTSGKNPEPAQRKTPSMTVYEDDSNTLQIDIAGDYSRISSNAVSKPVALGLIGQIATLGTHGRRVDQDGANFVVGFVDAMKPKDAAEALLLTQMAATHQATMMLARRLNHVENIPQQDAAERALNKLARSYAAQMDTLKRYRSKGQQTVRVERVTVESGGQAVVGNVESGGRGREGK
ncbi:hypothetical protein [Marivita sp. GX14005]|uniref:hypothetical protein n=1 Tax=Marivita sp. GX14005 TaxID=2942276 RepID=UPI002018DE7D|nr:hypothetical protein [Marivita sp. GX14005]MCL3880765.1 hypothetical protein [Marivita sp. GX14005]